MTEFNEAVQAIENAHAICLKALDNAFLKLIKEVGVKDATNISIDYRNDEAHGEVLIGEKWLPIKIKLGMVVVYVKVDNEAYTRAKTMLLCLNDVYKAEEILGHSEALLDAANEGLLSAN